MNTDLEFTNKDISELIYLLHNAPIDISLKGKTIIPMNGYWYTAIDERFTDDTFKEFHDAVVWLLNPFWEEVSGHPYK